MVFISISLIIRTTKSQSTEESTQAFQVDITKQMKN